MLVICYRLAAEREQRKLNTLLGINELSPGVVSHFVQCPHRYERERFQTKAVSRIPCPNFEKNL